MRSELGPWLASALLCAALASGCADFERGEYWKLDDGTGDAGSGGEAGEYRYAADVHPLLDAGCERCHAQGNSAGNTGYLLVTDDVEASYTAALAFVDADKPADSRLLSKMAGSGHGGGVIYDDRSAEYDLVLAWIEQGTAP